MGLRDGFHRLSIDISEEMWNDLVKVATMKNITVSTLVRQIVYNTIIEEQKY